MPANHNPDTLTLHIRLTKKCQAHCTYCSSHENLPAGLMPLADLPRALAFLVGKITELKLGGARKMLTVQYVGGEILTVPTAYIKIYAESVHAALSPLFQDFRHGAQSNLIGSPERLRALADIFNNNIGTSIDSFSEARKVAGSAKAYKIAFHRGWNQMRKLNGRFPAGIVVVDKQTRAHLLKEVKIMEEHHAHLTLRPVFSGGSPIDGLSIDELDNVLGEVFEQWFMKSSILIEPFSSLLQKRLHKLDANLLGLQGSSGCPFQHACGLASLNMEPDGTLYICLDTADSAQLPFGNALAGTWDAHTHNSIVQRSQKISSDCLSCEWFDECQGGCMSEAIRHTGDVFGKTLYCQIWKMLFRKIDNGISLHGRHAVQDWLKQAER